MSRSFMLTSRGLAGPDIGELLQLFPEPKRCERGRYLCSVGRCDCQSGEQTTGVLHVIGKIQWPPPLDRSWLRFGLAR